jgi:hypothetical protein
LERSIYISHSSEKLAALTVDAMRLKNIQIVAVDEAGTLPLDAIRGMILISDLAKKINWDLTLILIGMDDLPKKIQQLPQIKARVNEWCRFEPYELEEMFDLLRRIEPVFVNHSLDNKQHLEQIKFIHDQFQGTIGLIIPFLRRLRNYLNGSNDVVDLELLMAVQLMFLRDRDLSISDADKNYLGEVVEKKEEELLENGM